MGRRHGDLQGLAFGLCQRVAETPNLLERSWICDQL